MGVIRPPFYCSDTPNVKFLYNSLSLLYNIVTFLNERMTSSTADKYTTTEYGKQNKFAVNPQPWIDDADKDYDHWKVAESTNGRMAMIGFFALVHNYILFGQVMPGIF